MTAPIDGASSRAEVTRGNLVTGGNNGGTLLTTIVSIDPIYVYFEGDEHAYLRYNAAGARGRATELARLRQSGARRARERRRAFRTKATWISSTTS